MMDSREQNFIADALNFAHLAELPEAAKKNTVWLEGIAKIRLANNSVAYGIVRRNAEDMSSRVLYINGDTAAMVEIEEVYPYVTLDKTRVKKFTPTEKEKARIDYLKSLELPYLEGVDLEAMTMDGLNKEVVKAAMYEQLKDLNTRKA